MVFSLCSFSAFAEPVKDIIIKDPEATTAPEASAAPTTPETPEATVAPSAPVNNTSKSGKNLVYTSLGDSASNGYGMDEYYIISHTPDPRVYKYNKVVDRAYPSMFSRAIGATTFYQDCTAGLRSEDLLYLLDPLHYQGDAFTAHIFREDVMYQLSKDGVKDFTDLSNRYIKHVTDADVITLDIGLNNFGEFLIKQTNLYRSGQSPYPVTLNSEAKSLLNSATFRQLKSALRTVMAATKNPVGLVDVIIESLAYAYVDNLKCFDKIIDRIYELNPDVELYVLGLFDCFSNDLYLVNNTINLGKYNRMAMESVNKHYKSYSNKYTYVDVIDVETFGLPSNVIGTDFMDKLGEDNSRLSHPNYNGHLYMYNQLAAKAKENGWKLNDIFKGDPNVNNSGTSLILRFTDVPKGCWFYDGVKFCADNGITNGITETQFDPDGNVTRAQMATFIYRLAGKPEIADKTEPFKDVYDSDWSHDAIAWAYHKGVIKGISENAFDPNSPVTRGQAVTMLCRFTGPMINSTSYARFKDASSIPGDFQSAVSWAVDNKIINGFPDGTFQPNAPITRAQMATMLQRYCEGK